ncbi:unnamed protein product, partial [Polarella glacialis]
PRLNLALLSEEGHEYFLSTNNEIGLRPEDVVAICDVNASSKLGQQGFTGQKGIGWKSCFQVSDCPHMLSGPFTFKFDIAGPLGKLGYVTPTWLDALELAGLPQAVRDAHEAGSTVIYLPLRPGAVSGVSAALRHLEEHHVCLLFMRRLCCLGIEYD